MNTIQILFVGTAIFSFAACSKHESPNPQGIERTETPSQPATPPLDMEALTIAEKGFAMSWTQVGDSWFTMSTSGRSEYLEMKGLMYEVAPQELSEADTLNELQWHGQVRISCRASRSYGHDWGSELPDRAYMYEFTHYDLAKRKGQWTIPPSPPSYYTKPSEAEIKKLLAQ